MNILDFATVLVFRHVGCKVWPQIELYKPGLSKYTVLIVCIGDSSHPLQQLGVQHVTFTRISIKLKYYQINNMECLCTGDIPLPMIMSGLGMQLVFEHRM